MTDYTGILLGAFLSVGGTLITLYLYMNYMKNRLFDEAFDWFSLKMKNEDAAKVVWQLGALLGNGIKSGTGLGNMMGRGGKLNLTDLIGGMIQKFLFGQGDEESGEKKAPIEDKRTVGLRLPS